MIYTDAQLKEKIVALIDSFENEVVEFKEARSNFSFNDIGKYFSALSNEDLDLSPNASTGLYKKLYQEAIDKYMKES